MASYRTKQESIAVSGVANLQIRSLFDHLQFDDPLGMAARVGISAATWPLFGLLWPSGAELAAQMAARPVTPGERILEVGCGLGLASLVGHRKGADVTASDCHPLAAEFLAENLRLNGLAPMKYRHGQWGATAPSADASSSYQTPREEDNAAVSGQFDLIMGSDVLYERDDNGDLAGFIEAHAAPGAQVWIVDPHRSNRPAFNRQMDRLGFSLTEQRLDRLVSVSRKAYRGRLLSYHRRESIIR